MTTPPRKDVHDDAETTDQLRQDIERTRQELGETVEALAHKVNVPERAKTAARETREKVTVTAAEIAEQARTAALRGAETLQAKANVAADKAKAVGEQVRAQLPPPLEHRAGKVMTTVQQRPIQTVVVLVVVFLLVRRMLRRRKSA
jgi:hypothetical protein